MAHYRVDPELKTVADSIIKKSHPVLAALSISYMFRDEAVISNGKTIAGMTVRVDDRNWALHKKDFIIEVAKDVWLQASDAFKAAIMDHELSHIGIRMDENQSLVVDDGTGRIKSFVRPHDIEEFGPVLERHGAYHQDLRKFLLAYAESKVKEKLVKKDDKTV